MASIPLESELIPYEAASLPPGPYLVFAPHPDDETLGMGGTIALAAAAGIGVTVVFVTAGDKGGDPGIRVREAETAVKTLGVCAHFHLMLHDREVYDEALPERYLRDIVHTVDAATIFLPSFQEIHPDHRATTAKILGFLNRYGFIENPPPHHGQSSSAINGEETSDGHGGSSERVNGVSTSLPTLWFYEINRQGEVNRLIDITPVIKIKKEAISCYESQLQQLDYSTQAHCMDVARSITLGEGVDYVEGFWCHEPREGDGESNETPPPLSAEAHYFSQMASYRVDGASLFPISSGTPLPSPLSTSFSDPVPSPPSGLIKGKQLWVKGFETVTRRFRDCCQPFFPSLPPSHESQTSPFIIILPLLEDANTPCEALYPTMLMETIHSILFQNHPNWQLLLYGVTTRPQKKIQDIVKKERRIRWVEHYRSETGKADGTYEDEARSPIGVLVEKMAGRMVLIVDVGDTLSPHALHRLEGYLKDHPEADFVYSDEDAINTEGRRHTPFFKPDWSPDLLMSCMYIGRLCAIRSDLFLKAGAVLPGYDDGSGVAWEYELILRISELTSRIHHIPEVLYHRRDNIPRPSADVMNGAAFDAVSGQQALERALVRQGIHGTVSLGLTRRSYRVMTQSSASHHHISIIIPFKDNIEVLDTCIHSILTKTVSPPNATYEILCVNNQSSEDETFVWMEGMRSVANLSFLDYDHPFNYSALNNFAVTQTTGDLLLFLNSDTEVISPEWLSDMVEQAEKPHVGAVGARLIYPNNTIQHAGIVLGRVAGLAGHAFKYVDRFDMDYYYGFSAMVRNVSGVTAACMMVKRSLFERVGGFDEVQFKVAYNDVDFCLKLVEKGYRIVYTPYAELYHHESYTRSDPFNYTVAEAIRKKWQRYIDEDPYYNVNLTTTKEDWTPSAQYHRNL